MGELSTRKIRPDGEGTEQMRMLYTASYGGRKTIPFDDLVAVSDRCDLIGLYDGDVFVGFFFTLRHKGVDIVLYMAIVEHLRRKGYGTQAVRIASRVYEGDRIVLLPDAPGVGDRLQNTRYTVIRYLDTLGFEDALYRYHFLNYDYQVLCYGGTVSKDEMDDSMRSLRRYLRCR